MPAVQIPRPCTHTVKSLSVIGIRDTATMLQPIVDDLQCMEVSACLQALAQARVEEAAFDASRLVDFSERLVFEGPAMQLTPLVCTL